MKKVRAILEYLAALLIILILLSVIGSVVIVKFYGKDLQEYAMDIINDQLDTKISIDEVGISIFKKFPNTVVFLNNVTVWSGHEFHREDFRGVSTDTLFVAERIYLQFNAIDLLKKKYSIKGLEARNGELNILIDSLGVSNFKLGGNNTNSDSSRFIEIKGVELKNLAVHYINLAKEIEGKGIIRDIFFEGNFSKQNYLLKVGGTAYIAEIKDHDISYLSHQELKSDIALKVDNNQYSINKGELSLGDLSAVITGVFLVDKEVGVDLDLHLIGKHISIDWISELLASKNKSPEGFSGTGNINLAVDVVGLATPTLRPHIESSFSTQNAFLGIETLPIEMRSLSLKGSYSNGPDNSITSTIIKLESFSTIVGNSIIKGKLQLKNLLNPQFNIQVDGNIFAADVSDYLSEFPLDILGGNLLPELNIQGTINNLAGSSKKVTFRPAGTVEIKDLSFLVGQNHIPFHSLNGILDITTAKIGAKIKGYFSETDLEIDLSVNNPFTVLDKTPYLQIEGSLFSTNIDIDKILNEFNQDKDGEKTTVYPKNIGVILDFNFGRSKIGEIITKKVSGTIEYKYPGLYLDPFYLETMNGVINSRIALIDLYQPVHQLIINSNYSNVNVQDLFRSFNNFGQDFLTDQNIAGNISGESEFLSSINNDFTINTSEIVSKNSFVVENGELNNFQPMIELSDFLKIDKMDHIQFSNISNTVLINENRITIPEMDIKSSAINLQASGTHSFDKTFEYHVATKLSDILFNKANSARNKEFDIALDKEDQRTIFLVLYDKGDGTIVEFDEDQAMKKIRNDLKEEKNELKVVLNEEFGLYKNDRVVKENSEKTEVPLLRFEFTDDENSDTIKSNPTKKLKWWQRKKETDKKPEFEFVIDDSDI